MPRVEYNGHIFMQLPGLLQWFYSPLGDCPPQTPRL
jgi:hypothetical protein